jgi:hypothetical protein
MPKQSTNSMENKMIMDVFKNIIIEQNKEFLKQISQAYKIDYDYLLKKYIKPEYYLPIIKKYT